MFEPIVVTDRPKRQVSIRLALEHMVLTEARYGAGEYGPDPHVHRLYADCFYVLDGAVTLSLADGDRVLDPGTFALVPPNVVHTFRNDGPGEARYLNTHAPGMGFDRYIQEIGGTGDAFRFELGPGDAAVVPPGTVHGFANTLDTPTRFLDVHAPGGFENYFRELAGALDSGPRDPAVIAQIGSRYDMRLV